MSLLEDCTSNGGSFVTASEEAEVPLLTWAGVGRAVVVWVVDVVSVVVVVVCACATVGRAIVTRNANAEIADAAVLDTRGLLVIGGGVGVCAGVGKTAPQ